MRYMYNKLFTKILDSSIWLESTPTRLLWMVFIAAMDEDGFCAFASMANLAHRARLSLDETKSGVEALEAPDENSSDPENDGRRIERVQGGWIVLNAKKYRELVTREAIREQTRIRVARYRKKRTGNDDVTTSNEAVTQSETGAEAVSKAETKAKADKSGYSVPACFESVDGFSAALAGWIEARKAKRNPATGRAIQILINRLQERPADAIAALDLATERGWATMNWEWFDKAKPSTSQRNGEYQEQIDIEKFTFRA